MRRARHLLCTDPESPALEGGFRAESISIAFLNQGTAATQAAPHNRLYETVEAASASYQFNNTCRAAMAVISCSAAIAHAPATPDRRRWTATHNGHFQDGAVQDGASGQEADLPVVALSDL